MKLYSSSPTPQKYPPARSRTGWLRRRFLSRVFSLRTAWWIFVIIVVVFAITIVKMFRQVIEIAPQ